MLAGLKTHPSLCMYRFSCVPLTMTLNIKVYKHMTAIDICITINHFMLTTQEIAVSVTGSNSEIRACFVVAAADC